MTVNDVIDTIMAALVAGITDPPDRRYISAGGPPFVDCCEQLVGYGLPAGLKPTTDFPSIARTQRKGITTRLVHLGFDLTRSIAIQKMVGNERVDPTEAELDADGRRMNDDSEAMYAAMLGVDLSDCDGYAFLGIDVGPRSRGHQTLTAQAVVGL